MFSWHTTPAFKLSKRFVPRVGLNLVERSAQSGIAAQHPTEPSFRIGAQCGGLVDGLLYEQRNVIHLWLVPTRQCSCGREEEGGPEAPHISTDGIILLVAIAIHFWCVECLADSFV